MNEVPSTESGGPTGVDGAAANAAQDSRARPAQSRPSIHIPTDDLDARRRLLADWCRMLGDQFTGRGRSHSLPLPADAMSSQAAHGTNHDLAAPAGELAAHDAATVETMTSSPLAAACAALSPRVRQTLQRLLAGDSEKQIAAHLKISPHTTHVYVKAIYRQLNVSSRGELLARFVDQTYRTTAGNDSGPM